MDTFEGQDSKSLHKYLYAEADPVMKIDPTGQFGIEVLVPLAINAIIQTSFIRSITSFDSARVAVLGLGIIGTLATLRKAKNIEEEVVRVSQNTNNSANAFATLVQTAADGLSNLEWYSSPGSRRVFIGILINTLTDEETFPPFADALGFRLDAGLRSRRAAWLRGHRDEFPPFTAT